MNIAEFFVSLGIKGAEKTVSAVESVSEKLKNLKNMSLETKAAILGIFYALEQGIAKSGQMGLALKQFEVLSGKSSEALQRYQYIARGVGVSNEDMESTFTGITDELWKMLNGLAKAPELMAQFQGSLSAAGYNIAGSEILDWQKRPELLLERMRQFAAIPEGSPGGMSAESKKQVMQSFKRIPDSVINMIMQQKNTKAALNAVPQSAIWNTDQLNSLQKAYGQWMQMMQEIEKMFGNFWSQNGPTVVKAVRSIVESLLKLITALTKFENKTHAIEKIMDYISKHPQQVLGGLIGSKFGGGLTALAGAFLGDASEDTGNDPTRKPHFWDPKGPRQHHLTKIIHHIQQNMFFQHPGVEAHKLLDSAAQAIKRYLPQITTKSRSS